MAGYARLVTGRLQDGLLVFLTFIVQRHALVDSICPDGYIHPDCSQQCPLGFYGLNCSSSCPGTCLNYSCYPTTGSCLRCRPGFTGSTCTKRCNAGRFGVDCARKCPSQCDGKPCNPFTGFCLKCRNGYTGKKCGSPPLKTDAELEGKTSNRVDVDTEENKVLILSLMIVALLTLPLCVLIVVLPKVKRTIKKKRRRRRQRLLLMNPSLETAAGDNSLYCQRLQTIPQRLPFKSVSETMDEKAVLCSAWPCSGCLANYPQKSRINSRRSEWRSRGGREHRPIYVAKRTEPHLRLSSSSESIVSMDIHDLERSRNRQSINTTSLVSNKQSRFNTPPNAQDRVTFLATRPSQEREAHPNSSPSHAHACKTKSDDVVDTNLPQEPDCRKCNSLDHQCLFFKTVPREDNSPQPNARQSREQAEKDERGVENATDSSENTSPASESNEAKEISWGHAERLNKDNEETRGCQRKTGSAQTTESSSDSHHSKVPQNETEEMPDPTGGHSWQKNPSERERTMPEKLRSDWSIVGYKQSCTLALALDECSLSPYQSTTRPLSAKHARSPYTILANMHSLKGLGRMVNLAMAYVLKTRYPPAPVASLALTNQESNPRAGYTGLNLHLRPGKGKTDNPELSQSLRFENEEARRRPTTLSTSQSGMDEIGNYRELINSHASHPMTLSSNDNSKYTTRQYRGSAFDTLREFQAATEREATGESSTTPSLAEESSDSSHHPRSFPETSFRAREHRPSFIPRLRNPNSNKGEMFELCSDEIKANQPLSITPSKRITFTIDSVPNVAEHISRFDKCEAMNALPEPLTRQFTSERIGDASFPHSRREIRNLDERCVGREDDCLSYSPPQTECFVGTPLWQDFEERYSNSPEGIAILKAEGRQNALNLIAQDNVELLQKRLNCRESVAWDDRFPCETICNLDDQAADVLSINCNQPIVTRTGRDRYKIRREDNARTFEERFPPIGEDMFPWEMPCNRLPSPKEVFAERQAMRNTIPPINAGHAIKKLANFAMFKEDDSRVFASESSFMSPLGLSQPPIHYSAKPASVQAADIYLGKVSQIMPNNVASADTVEEINFDRASIYGKVKSQTHPLSCRQDIRAFGCMSGCIGESLYDASSVRGGTGHPPTRRIGPHYDSCALQGSDIRQRYNSTSLQGNMIHPPACNIGPHYDAPSPQENAGTNLLQVDSCHDTDHNDVESIYSLSCFHAENSTQAPSNHRGQDIDSRSRSSGWKDRPCEQKACANASLTKVSTRSMQVASDPCPSEGFEGAGISWSSKETVEKGASEMEAKSYCTRNTSQAGDLTEKTTRSQQDTSQLDTVEEEDEEEEEEEEQLDTPLECMHVATETGDTEPSNDTESVEANNPKECQTEVPENMSTGTETEPLQDNQSDYNGGKQNGLKTTVDDHTSPYSTETQQSTESEAPASHTCSVRAESEKVEESKVKIRPRHKVVSLHHNKDYPRNRRYRYPTPSLLEDWVGLHPQIRKGNEDLNYKISSESDSDSSGPTRPPDFLCASGGGGGSAILPGSEVATSVEDILSQAPRTVSSASERTRTYVVGCEADKYATHGDWLSQKDSDDSEEFKDAVSFSSLRRRSKEISSRSENDPIMKSWPSNAQSHNTFYASSSESEYKTVDTSSQNEDSESGSENERKLRFIFDREKLDDDETRNAQNAKRKRKEKEPEARGYREDGSTSSKISAEHNTYTVEARDRRSHGSRPSFKRVVSHALDPDGGRQQTARLSKELPGLKMSKPTAPDSRQSDHFGHESGNYGLQRESKHVRLSTCYHRRKGGLEIRPTSSEDLFAMKRHRKDLNKRMEREKRYETRNPETEGLFPDRKRFGSEKESVEASRCPADQRKLDVRIRGDYNQDHRFDSCRETLSGKKQAEAKGSTEQRGSHHKERDTLLDKLDRPSLESPWLSDKDDDANKSPEKPGRSEKRIFFCVRESDRKNRRKRKSSLSHRNAMKSDGRK